MDQEGTVDEVESVKPLIPAGEPWIPRRLRECAVCHGPIKGLGRRVCPGVCAETWKVRLQRNRRERARR